MEEELNNLLRLKPAATVQDYTHYVNRKKIFSEKAEGWIKLGGSVKVHKQLITEEKKQYVINYLEELYFYGIKDIDLARILQIPQSTFSHAIHYPNASKFFIRIYEFLKDMQLSDLYNQLKKEQ